ncbi:MAG: substrate-binding domain-containing protein, partial [Bacteroidales bacterium]|nr:substrate-binding domain-containing protein [Bacteroidales bacterium]
MTDFSEAYANKLLQGIMRYSHEHEPWVVCKVPLRLRDSGRLEEVVRFTVAWKADAIIGQFRSVDDVDGFRRNGIIPIAQDYRQHIPGIVNISGDYALSGRICADYFIEKGVKSFAFFGLHGFVWSDERRDSYFAQIRSRMPEASTSLLEKYDADEAWWYDLERITKWLRSLPKPVGILACDDQRAYYIMEASKLGGEGMRIPNDIMVLGVDNDETVCQLTSPALSSLNQATEDAGYNAAKVIDQLLALPPSQRFKEVEDIVVRPTFITARSSTDAFI